MMQKPAAKAASPANPFRAKLMEMRKSMGPEFDGIKGQIMEAFISDGFSALNPEERKVLQKHMKPELAWVLTKMVGRSIEPLIGKIMQGEEDEGMESEVAAGPAPAPAPPPAAPAPSGPNASGLSFGPPDSASSLMGGMPGMGGGGPTV